MSQSLRNKRILAAALLSATWGMCGLGELGWPSAQAQTWRGNVPDSFQHQRWGARGAQAILNWPAGVPGAADAAGDSTWECAGYFQLCAAPAASIGQPCAANLHCDNPAGAGNGACGPGEEAGFYGMCFQATTVNLLYYSRQLNYMTFGGRCTAPAASVGMACTNNAACDNPAGAGNGVCTATNTANTDELHDQVKVFEDAHNAAAGATTSTKINNVLDVRGTGPSRGLDGLLAQNFKQVGNQVKYISSDGTQKDVGRGTLYDHVVALFKARDMTNLRLAYPHDLADNTGTPQEPLWWAGTAVDGGNFHNVTVAGFDANTLYFADPDSNPVGGNGGSGNRNVDGGWVTHPGGNLNRWKNAAAAAAVAGDVKPERFAAAAAIPKPAGAAPTAAEHARLYFTGTLAANKKEFSIPAGRFDRYDAVQIRYLETLETIKGVAKPAGAGTPGTGKGLSFTPGPVGVENRINDIWVFPASLDQVIVAASFAHPADEPYWLITLFQPGQVMVPGKPANTDPWDNQRQFGALHVTTRYGSAGTLADGQQLDLNYDSSSSQDLSAWDMVYNDKLDATLSSLGVQCHGPLCGYNLETKDLVPTAGACCAGNSCSIVQPADCTGTFLGAGTPCNPNPCVCDDGNACTSDSGDPVNGCLHTNEPNGIACDDDNACMQNDVCNNGNCAGTNPISCNDGNSCTADSCDPASGCTHPIACDDGDVCTADSCSGSGCVHTSGSVPGEAGNVNLSKDGSMALITWSLGLGAMSSDVVRGVLSSLPVGPGGGDETCIADDIIGTLALDGTVPAPGSGVWYLVRGRNACGSGPYGNLSMPQATTTCP